MRLYAVSILAYRRRASGTDVRHTACAVDAANKDEAEGKASRIARKIYPPSDWDHDVAVKDASEIADPDLPLVTTDGFVERQFGREASMPVEDVFGTGPVCLPASVYAVTTGRPSIETTPR